MRILYLHQYFATSAMDGGTRSYEFARRLVQRGHDVQMITTDRSSESAFKGWYMTQEEGISVHWLPVAYNNHMGFYRRIRAFLHFAFAAGKKANELKGDVVLATSPPLTIALPSLYASKKLAIPLVFEVRDIWPRVAVALGILKSPILIFFSKLLEKRTYDAASHIIAVSPAIRDHVSNLCPGKEISVIPNGCDMTLFESGQREPAPKSLHFLSERKLIVYFGAIGKANDTSYIVRLAQKCARLDSSLAFLIIGNGKEETNIERLAQKLEVLNKNVFLHPAIKKQEIPSVLAMAKIAIVTLRDIEVLWTGSPNKIADALAAGIPIVTNFGGWLTQLLEKHQAGIRLEVCDLDLAAKKLVAVLSNEEWMASSRAAAERLARTLFLRENLTDEFELAITRVCANKPTLKTIQCVETQTGKSS